MLQNLKIGTRLAIGFGGLIVAAVAAFTGAVLLAAQTQADTATATHQAQQRQDTVHTMLEAQLQLVSAIRNAGLQTDGAQVNAEVDTYRQTLQRLKAQEAAFAQLALSADEKATLERAVRLRQQAEPVVDEALRFTMAFAAEEAAKALTQRLAPIQAQWAGQLSQLAKLSHERGEIAAQAIAQTSRQRNLALAGGLALVVVAAAAFAVLLTRSVTRPLRSAAALAERVAQGDLDVHIDATGRDEAAQLLRALQSMAEQLSGMVRAVRESTETIGHASSEISGGNLDLSDRTERTAGALQSTSAALQSLSGMVASNASHARDAHGLVQRTGQIAEQGGQAMQAVVSTMQGISDSSRRIADIIGVIDGIAFQTNILALNAAVEAARAGEQGRGFAVVASEVRALAQRVSSAAAEVRTLIGESVHRVDAGARLVGEMGSTMAQLVDGVGQVRGLIGDISSASTHQDEQLHQVNGSVRDIEATTQQNAALVEEVAAAAQSLSGQSQRLSALVNRFRVGAGAPD